MLYIHTCIHTYTYVRIAHRRGNVAYPTQCHIEEDPLIFLLQTLSPKGSRWVHLKFTQCPGEGGQEDLVYEGCHKQTYWWNWEKENIIISMLYTVHNTETYILHCILHTCPNLVSLLTVLPVASCIPKMNRSSPKERESNAQVQVKKVKEFLFSVEIVRTCMT